MFIVRMSRWARTPQGWNVPSHLWDTIDLTAHFTPTELDHARRMSINISSHIIPGDFTARLLNGIIVRRRNSITLHALHRKVDTLCLAASLAFEGGNKRTVDLSLISEAS